MQPWLPAPCLKLSHTAYPQSGFLSQQQASQSLGTEHAVVVFDGTQQFNADAFAIALGTLSAGGLLLVWLPLTHQSLWIQRFKQQISQFCLHSETAFNWQPGMTEPVLPFQRYQPARMQLTGQQQTVIKAVHQVANGHRHRPLLVTADRGRGKSTALGIAAAQLLQAGKQRIVVTAPRFSNVKTFFRRAAEQLSLTPSSSNILQFNQATLQFMAPDRLLTEQPQVDLLIVDEAAALPQTLLRQMLKQHNRIVFSSTIQGYEGSGKGLALRFQHFMYQVSTESTAVQLTEPLRWAADDSLEAFSQRALLLNAELADVTAKTFQLNDLAFKRLDAEDFLTDEALLNDIYGLLSQAHYRSRPSDVQALFSTDKQLYVAFNNKQVVAAVWLVAEGPIDQALALAVHRGERRCKGALIPQALLTHAGNLAAAQQRYQRIMRIAVHPRCQRNGLGSWLLDQLIAVLPPDTNALGCSFAATPELLSFWQNNGFKPVRLGLHADTMTASHAVIMLKPLTQSADDLTQALQQRFAEQWPSLLTVYFNQLDVGLVKALTRQLPKAGGDLSVSDKQDIESFLYAQRALEFSFVPLQQLVALQLYQPCFDALAAFDQTVLIQLFLQQQSTETVIKACSLLGHKALLQRLREILTVLYSAA